MELASLKVLLKAEGVHLQVFASRYDLRLNASDWKKTQRKPLEAHWPTVACDQLFRFGYQHIV